jgi:hypothetical protein
MNIQFKKHSEKFEKKDVHGQDIVNSLQKLMKYYLKYKFKKQQNH